MVLPPTSLALPIAVISAFIAAMALVASVAGRQSELATGLKIEVGRPPGPRAGG